MQTRKEFEAIYGEVWTTSELLKEFKVLQFMAPFALVVKKETDESGTVEFSHNPRFYFNFNRVYRRKHYV